MSIIDRPYMHRDRKMAHYVVELGVCSIQAALETLDYPAKGETNILYRLVACKVRDCKTLFPLMLMIISYSLTPKSQKIRIL